MVGGAYSSLSADNDVMSANSANNPFARLPEAADFTVTSATVRDGAAWAPEQLSGLFGVPGGEHVSPQLTWSGALEDTKSYAVTVYDPDAPTGSGFWHSAVADIPASVTELAVPLRRRFTPQRVPSPTEQQPWK